MEVEGFSLLNGDAAALPHAWSTFDEELRGAFIYVDQVEIFLISNSGDCELKFIVREGQENESIEFDIFAYAQDSVYDLELLHDQVARKKLVGAKDYNIIDLALKYE